MRENILGEQCNGKREYPIKIILAKSINKYHIKIMAE
jgi:hypothetical protein